MNKLLVILAMVLPAGFAAAESVSKEVVLNQSVTNVRLVDAQYELMPTETEVRKIPGCVPWNEGADSCEETVVVASRPIIRVSLSYQDNMFRDDSNQPNYTSVVFETTDFTAEQVELLKSVYPQWKHPFSNVARNFARNNFHLDVRQVKETIRVIDMERSKVCVPYGEGGQIPRDCKEELVYKESWRKVVVATVTKK